MSNNSELSITDLHKKGEELAEAGLITEAEQVYLKILSQSPDDLDAVISLGNIGFHLGNTRQAVQYYLQAACLSPANNELVMSVSCMLMDLDYPTEAGQITDAFFAGDVELLRQRLTLTGEKLNTPVLV